MDHVLPLLFVHDTEPLLEVAAALTEFHEIDEPPAV